MSFPRDVPRLTDGVVALRAHCEGDVDGVLEQCRDPLSQAWTTVPVPYTLSDARRFVREVVPRSWTLGAEWAFAVEAVDDDGLARFAGTVSLRDEGEGRAEVAYGSHPWVRGRGVMTRAVELLLAWGFEQRGLASVVWWANQGNWASRRLAWRLGFGLDGSLRQWLPQRGRLLDAWVGVLRAEDPRVPRHPWTESPRIVGRRVVLRPHREDDLDRLVEGGSDRRTAAWLSTLPTPYTAEHARSFLRSREELRATGRGVPWAVADPHTDEQVGDIALFDLDPGRQAELGYWAHPSVRGRGVTSEACALAVRHAVLPSEDGGLGLRRVYAHAADGNDASRRVLAAAGFREVGRERSGYALRDGSLVDSICYDVLAAEVRAPG